MKSGFLWYDASASPIERKIADAAKRYYEKFGLEPDICFVNEKDLPSESGIGQIKVSPKRTILPNHVWVGLAAK